jgi:hypothetical protein
VVTFGATLRECEEKLRSILEEIRADILGLEAETDGLLEAILHGGREN